MKDFIKYEQALALGLLGFKEDCIGDFMVFGNGDLQKNGKYGQTKPEVFVDWDSIQKKKRKLNLLHTFHSCNAPLYSQAFRWFREERNIYIEIKKGNNIKKGFCCEIDIWNDGIIIESHPIEWFKTYE